MHRLLKRQLRRALQLPAGVEPEAWLQSAQAGSDASLAGDPIDWPRVLAQLTEAVGESYQQLERDLELRARSLDISSKELFELNERLRGDLHARAESERLLLEAAERIAAVAGLPAVQAQGSGMQSLSQLIAALSNALADTQRAKAASEQRLDLALKAANLGMWDWDTTEPHVFFEEPFTRFIGRPELPREVPMALMISITDPADGARFNSEMVDLLRGRKGFFDVEHRVRHAEGHWVWLHTFGNVTARDAYGRALRVTGVIADITARKTMEAQLAENLLFVESLLEAIPLPVVVKDRDGRVLRLNAAWEALTGVVRGPQLGAPVLINDAKHRRISDETDRVVLDTGDLHRYEVTIPDASGRSLNALVHKAPLRRGGSGPDGVVAVITDITLQRQAAETLQLAKQQAEAAAAAKAQFLANMSHELRTPLNGVVGMASMLTTTMLDARQRRFVTTMKGSAEALIAIVNDILDFSKADAGKLQTANDIVPLHAQLDDVVSLFAARAFDKGLDLAGVVLDDCPAAIVGDPVRLRQVLGNLVNNAIKFTERGQVVVAAEPVAASGDGGDAVRIVVTDTGIGIEPEQAEHVFDAFAQADASITRRFGGTGLGLAISRQLVAAMGGDIGFDSKPRVGSRFWIVLPAAPQSRQQPRVDAQRSDDARLGESALIIAPHGPIRDTLQRIAASRYGDVLATSEIPDAIEALTTWPCEPRSLRVVLDDAFIHGEATALADWLVLERREWCVTWRGLRCPTDERAPAPGLECLTKPVPLCEAFGPQQVVAVAGTRTPDAVATDAAVTDHAATDPVATDAPASVAGTPAHAAERGLPGARVLVVEDNPVNHEIVRAMLEHLGVTVLTAMNGAEGVAAVRDDPDLDIVLMDCQMPVMDGFTAAATIRRELPERASLPIVALTGNAMPGDREACHAAGMDDYLTKPLVLPVLERALRHWLAARAPASAAVTDRQHAVA
jgi:PAS domain S-box-containing protein